MKRWYFNIQREQGSTITRTFVVEAPNFVTAMHKAKEEAQHWMGIRDPWIIEGGMK